MSFPALLISLFIDRVFPDVTEWRRFAWLRSYIAWWTRQQWLGSLQNSSWLGAISLLPLLALVACLQYLLLPPLGALPVFVIESAILLLCLGPANLDQAADRLAQAHAENATALGHILADSGVPDTGSDNPPEERIRHGLLLASCRRYIGPVCWFALLGPVGAVAYRLSEQTQATPAYSQAPWASDWFDMLNWIPARANAAAFAIAGDFEAVASAWKLCRPDSPNCAGNDALLIATGEAALGDVADLGPIQRFDNTLQLAWRSLGAIVTILGVAWLLSLF